MASRRLRLVALIGLVAVAVAATLTFAFSGGSNSVSTSLPPGLPVLHLADANGTLVALDRRRQVAVFRISCGWHVTPITYAKTKLEPGLYRVSLHNVAFNVGSLANWERIVLRSGWSGLIQLEPDPVRPFISNRASADCSPAS
jgi:hypothetical protein